MVDRWPVDDENAFFSVDVAFSSAEVRVDANLGVMQVLVADLVVVVVLGHFDADFPVVLLLFCLMLLSWMFSIHSPHSMLLRLVVVTASVRCKYGRMMIAMFLIALLCHLAVFWL